ncbi:hypothetical protein [Tengunoibacter tsumagoiensis]|uniref:Uncharacterized protein n=1 Tax=Tengunoibacter tsumagoiensis TaxID=2014871 RepID=A0A402A4D3_9CHLR|nr:hypothetical protein [Tengunoibacter tsumagoiensis]GCE13929.1 hypothetical protein KTT_37880 [Tengunoibacter tsumagoiensis]
MQQKQQPANFDLLAVFPDEALAEAASAKLRKEGFTDDEVHQMDQSIVSTNAVFREHGPDSNRRNFFLETRRSGPNPWFVAFLAILFGVVLSALLFGTTFVIPALPRPGTVLIGAAIGIVLGLIIGLLQRGRVRGAIGQAPTTTTRAPVRQLPTARTVVALTFDDPENISRKSRARAILLNNKGKIDRSVKRQV